MRFVYVYCLYLVKWKNFNKKPQINIEQRMDMDVGGVCKTTYLLTHTCFFKHLYHRIQNIIFHTQKNVSYMYLLKYL